MKRRALISVTDKAGVEELASGLAELGFSILSTGGTFEKLRAAGVEAQPVAEYTGFPEIMGGRVKTLHPRIHGGILARRDDPATATVMAAHGIDAIDLVVVNLYRFRQTLEQPGVTQEEIVENIDIGGPAMLRSAAKNHAYVAVVVDPADYPRVLDALRAGALEPELRRELAAKAFAHTAEYDAAIAAWFAASGAGGEFGARVSFLGEKVQSLRYGENPHQPAAFYRFVDGAAPCLARARQLGGKELSYNNILDLDAALSLALEFEEPACVVVKHNNPCGTAVADTPVAALAAALAGDPVSAFGSIIALNRALEADTAHALAEEGSFVEALLVPSVEDGALSALQDAKWSRNLRVLALGAWPVDPPRMTFRQVSGGFLVQHPDAPQPGDDVFGTVTARAPDEAERVLLAFAWKVAKHVKSNAIVLAQRAENGALATVGVGAGQMSRVDAVEIAAKKAGERARGSVLASDAFFPFPDGLEAAAAAGVTAVAQPGGSRRDGEVIKAAEKAGMAMVFTGRRHFRH